MVYGLFLTPSELENVRQWTNKVNDRSLTTKMLTPLWDKLAKRIPSTIAPNVITLLGLVCQLLAYWVVEHSDTGVGGEAVASGVACALTYAYMTLGAVDGRHARNTKNSSSLGELFEHACASIGGVFGVVTVCRVLSFFEGLRDLESGYALWYVTQCFGIIFLFVQVTPFNAAHHTIKFSHLAGPGELLHLAMALMLLRAVSPSSIVDSAMMWGKTLVIESLVRLGEGFPEIFRSDAEHVLKHATDSIDMHMSKVSVLHACRGVYILVHVYAAVKLLIMKREHLQTKVGLAICLTIRFAPSLLLRTEQREPLMGQVICDGLFLCILSSDIILAKMAKRELHTLIIVLAGASVMSDFVVIAAAVFYHFVVFADICDYLQLPLLSPAVNVYCDGIFDLCHIGHKEQFRKALVVTNGNRLLVGVCNDKDSSGYKRPPVMNEEERYAVVGLCKYVSEVIRDAPIVSTAEFIQKHKIHLYAVGEEYQTRPEGTRPRPGDPDYKVESDYYRVPRELGILRFTSRTPGMSTTDLVQRIVDRQDELLSRNDQPLALFVPNSVPTMNGVAPSQRDDDQQPPTLNGSACASPSQSAGGRKLRARGKA
jgi:choline-phosphate cytidylyltransferase